MLDAAKPESPARTDSAPAVRVRSLTRRYPSGAAVGPLTFDVPRGAITGLVGPNGVGKTTTIRMLLGLIKPDDGDVRVLEAEAWGALPGVLDRVGALVDGPTHLATLSGRDNLRLLARLAGWPDSSVDTSLEVVGLTDRGRQKVKEYSLGMRQRLALAGALLGEPELLIVDEPANGLDPQGVVELRGLLRRVAQTGATVVVSSHVLTEIEQVCDHLVVLSGEGVAFHGSRVELTSRLRGSMLLEVADPGDESALADLLRARDFEVEAAAGVLRVAGPPTGGTPDGGRINALAIEAGIVLSRIEPHVQSLEEVFFELTGDPGSTAERLGSVAGEQPQSSRRRFRR